ncbi:copper chaperone PCu(A)C [Methylobacterium sp. ID0610]|uniref:copper chaperone PCu(A)C n=1 Tax=Methylobacterium carpenticola TaxID=3344827 RepID=UPI0036D0A001
MLGATSVCHAGDVEIVGAWIAPAEKPGLDVPLQMAVLNRAAEADALLRLRCPFANFSEKVTVDRGGEGPPARRAIPTIAIKAAGETVLTAEGAHVMLLQTRQPLAEGERFVCAASFRKAGPVDVAVDVRRGPPAR